MTVWKKQPAIQAGCCIGLALLPLSEKVQGLNPRLFGGLLCVWVLPRWIRKKQDYWNLRGNNDEITAKNSCIIFYCHLWLLLLLSSNKVRAILPHLFSPTLKDESFVHFSLFADFFFFFLRNWGRIINSGGGGHSEKIEMTWNEIFSSSWEWWEREKRSVNVSQRKVKLSEYAEQKLKIRFLI